MGTGQTCILARHIIHNALILGNTGEEGYLGIGNPHKGKQEISMKIN